MWKKKTYDKKCTVICADNFKRLDATVINFTANYQLAVKAGQMTLDMLYNPRMQSYIAHNGGKEYRSVGPKELS